MMMTCCSCRPDEIRRFVLLFFVYARVRVSGRGVVVKIACVHLSFLG